MAHLPPAASGVGAHRLDQAADPFAALEGLRAADGRQLRPCQDSTECSVALLEPTGIVRWAEQDYAAVTGAAQPVEGDYWPDSLPAELREAAARMLAELAESGSTDRILPCFTPDLRWLRIRLLPVSQPDGTQLLLARLDDLSGLAGELAVGAADPGTADRAVQPACLHRHRPLPPAATAGFTGALAVDIRRFRRINEVWARRAASVA